jgi:hypothetical protein
MAFATKVTRPVNPPPKPGRDEYLNGQKICNVLRREEGERRYYWLTPVLGSGCSTSPEQVKSLTSLIQGISSALGPDAARSLDGIPLNNYVYGFLEELVRDRAHLPAALASDQDNAVQVPPWLVDLAIASALTTHLYIACKALSPTAPLRSTADDKVTVPANSQAMGRYLRRDVVVPALEAVKRAAGRLEEVRGGLAATAPFEHQEAEQSLTWFIARLETLLGRLQVRLGSTESLQLEWSDVDALAEVVWFSLTCLAEPGVYPGWTDLMFALSCSVGPLNEDHLRGIRVPTFEDLTRAADVIRRHYRVSTEQAYQRERPALYKAAAAALSAEASFRAQLMENRTLRPPPATAFITSFDIELEMALLDKGQPFILVVPAYLVSRGVAHTCWLSVEIEAKDGSGLGPLLQPAPEQWRVFNDSIVQNSSVPIVVRLAGCPLATLPPLHTAPRLKQHLLRSFDGALRKQYEPDDFEAKAEVEAELDLHHAILLNEYDATWHNSLDLIEAARRGAQDTSRDTHEEVLQQRLSLPHRVASVVGAARWRRFWFLLGVQMQDSAVRNRIMSLTSAVPMTSDDEAVLNSGRLGVAVNSRLASAERELLQWAGLDVVAGDAVDAAHFEGDLEHYALHLNEANGLPRDLDFKEGQCRR